MPYQHQDPYLGLVVSTMPRRRSVPSVDLPPFQAEPNSGKPLYIQLVDHIEAAVGSGVLQAGDRLPGEPVLVNQLGLSRATIRHAVDQLVERGVLMRQHGVGTQVMAAPESRPSGVISLQDELLANRQTPSTTLLKYAVVPVPDEIGEELGLDSGTEVVYIERLRFNGDRPIAIMRNWLHPILPEVDREALESTGLYELLRKSDIVARLAHQTVGARLATKEEAKLLDLQKTGPVLTLRTTAFAGLGQPIEHGRHSFRSDSYEFDFSKIER